MDIKETRQRDILVVSVSGKLDVVTSPLLEAQLLERIDAGQKQVLIDLSAVDYVSSAGIRAFLVALKRSKEKQGQLGLCGLVPEVRRVFDITGFSFRVPLFATLAEGLKGLGAPQA